MTPLTAAVQKDPFARTIVTRVLADRPRFIESVGDVGQKRIAERTGWVPLGADPELRRVTVATVRNRFLERSDRLLTAIDREPEKAAWDVLVIGAGPHGAVVANALANQESADPPRIVTLEATDDIGGTFRAIGSTIARNSANRAAEAGASVKRGSGDKNPSSGPWGDPDLSGSEWPEVGILADTATVNLFASGSDALMQTRYVGYKKRSDVPGSESWPARYRVEMRTGDRTRFVYTNAIVETSGIGEADYTGLDPASVQLIEAAQKEIDWANPDKVPGVLNYRDALALASLSKTGRDPYRAPVGATDTGAKTVTTLKPSQRVVLRVLPTEGKEEEVDVTEVETLAPNEVRMRGGRVIRARMVTAEVARRSIDVTRTASLRFKVAPSAIKAQFNIEAGPGAQDFAALVRKSQLLSQQLLAAAGAGGLEISMDVVNGRPKRTTLKITQ
jgi:hypothetical protein